MAPANVFKLKFPKPYRRARGVRRFIMFSTLFGQFVGSNYPDHWRFDPQPVFAQFD